MSTNGMESWAVDLAEVGAVYPFQGTEGIMVLIAVLLWLGWHVWQIRFENEDIRKDMAHPDRQNLIKQEVDKY